MSRRSSLLLSVFAAAASPLAPAFAQVAAGASVPAPNAPQSEEIVVTGSRLKTTNATSENPITVVTSAEIARSSSQTIEQVLQRLPAIGTSGIYSTTNNGGQGQSCTDIRNLGIARTLVLVNGRRFVETGGFGTQCVDLNNIPLDMVDRIEVLKDGASAIYGADAIAGVVNIILKKNFNGVQFRANGSIATENGDARTGEISALLGQNFDRGNITIGVDYENQEPVLQRDRSWGVPVVFNNNPKGKFTIGSGIPPNGRVFTDPNASHSIGSNSYALGNGKFTTYSRTKDGYDYGQQQYLLQALEKESFVGNGHYDFNENITGYLETYFTHRTSAAQLAPQPVTGGLSAAVPDLFVVPAGNPYNPFGVPVDLYKRVGEFGDRISGTSADTFQITGGFEGTIGGGWDYNTFFTYGQSDNVLTATNEVNFQRLEQELGFQQVAAPPGTPDPTTYGVYNPAVCNPALGCTLINPFGPNSISQAGVNYARFTERATSQFSLRTFGGSLVNNDVFDLPFGPLGITIGAEHRYEAGRYSPDTLVQSGVTLENAQQPTQGSFSVGELYGETRIPILANLPFAKDLHIDLGGRFFDYNTFGSGQVWKADFNYTPITGLRFRGNIGQGFRQPSINELYGGQALSFNNGLDPCARYLTYGAKAATVAANCAAQGINVNNFTQLGNAQVQTITGGNPGLQPETARTETLGAVIEPPFIPHLAITADYWRYKINGSIGSVDTQTILDTCYTSAGLSDPFCKLINPRDGQQQLTTVVGTLQNLGVTKTDGMDIGLTYTYLLPNGYGSLTLSNDLELLFDYEIQNAPNTPFIGQAGLIGSAQNSSGQPRQRDIATLDWTYGPWSAGYTMRYISGMQYYPILDPATNIATRVPGIFYHDIQGTYSRKNVEVTLGVSNLLDKKAPFVNDITTNTDPAVYDVLGRVVFVKTSFRF